jgi:hypothetical protein
MVARVATCSREQVIVPVRVLLRGSEGDMPFSALQYGLAGLSAILFVTLVGLLRAEQKRDQVRQPYLRAVYATMVVAIALMIVPAVVEVSKQMNDTAPLVRENAKLIAEKSALEKQLAEDNRVLKATETAAADFAAKRDLINTHLSNLSRWLDAKQIYILSNIPAEKKEFLHRMIVSMCEETRELKKITGGGFTSESCAEIDRALK